MWYYLLNPIISHIKLIYNFVTYGTIINQTIYAFCLVLKFLHKGAVVQSSTEDIISYFTAVQSLSVQTLIT